MIGWVTLLWCELSVSPFSHDTIVAYFELYGNLSNPYAIDSNSQSMYPWGQDNYYIACMFGNSLSLREGWLLTGIPPMISLIQRHLIMIGSAKPSCNITHTRTTVRLLGMCWLLNNWCRLRTAHVQQHISTKDQGQSDYDICLMHTHLLKPHIISQKRAPMVALSLSKYIPLS